MKLSLFLSISLLSSLAFAAGTQRLFQPGELIAFTMTDPYQDGYYGLIQKVRSVESGEHGETFYVLRNDTILVTDIRESAGVREDYIPSRYSYPIAFTNQTPGKIVELYTPSIYPRFQGNGRILNVPGMKMLKGFKQGDIVFDRRLELHGLPEEAHLFRSAHGDNWRVAPAGTSLLGFTSDGMGVIGASLEVSNVGNSKQIVYTNDLSWLKKRRSLTICNSVLSALLR